ncbi:MAG: hypothetical protein AMXMBFR13_47820 [Phycisphaerae bacterium]
MAGVEEENRRRIALVLLVAGAFLMIAGMGLVAYHYHYVHSVAPTHATRPIRMDTSSQARMIQQVLFLLLVLVGVLAISLYAFRRWNRRFRDFLFRKPHSRTPSEDVWAMHKLPDEALPGGARSGEGSSTEPEGGA